MSEALDGLRKNVAPAGKLICSCLPGTSGAHLQQILLLHTHLVQVVNGSVTLEIQELVYKWARTENVYWLHFGHSQILSLAFLLESPQGVGSPLLLISLPKQLLFFLFSLPCLSFQFVVGCGTAFLAPYVFLKPAFLLGITILRASCPLLAFVNFLGRHQFCILYTL